MKLILTTVLSILLLTSCIGAGDISAIKDNGKGYFPSLQGIDLTGANRPLPESLIGNHHILAIAFKRKQQEEVDTWINEMPSVIGKNEQVSFYEVPLIHKVNAPYRFWINNGMRSGISQPEARLRTITVYTEKEQFLELLGMNTNNIYLLLINKNGRILWRAEGSANKEKIDALKNAISTL
jgi:hypothetical protein